jgi:hypothetical protein
MNPFRNKVLSFIILIYSLSVNAQIINNVDNCVCVDSNGNKIPCPTDNTTFCISNNYYLKNNGIASHSIDNYNDNANYSPSLLTLKEENISNYNQIGNIPGTHWLTWYVKLVYKKETIIKSSQVKEWVCSEVGVTASCAWKTVTKITTETETVLDHAERYKGMKGNINTVNYQPGVIKQFTTLTDRPDIQKVLNVYSKGDDYNSLNCKVSAYVIMGKGDNDPWNNPVIVADGLDEGNSRSIQELIEDTYTNINSLTKNGPETVLGNGYDIIFVDFKDGAGNLIDNAKSLLKIIEYVCSKAPNNNVVVSGFSMGGVIGRISLLIGNKYNPGNISKVTKFISIDSPQDGAQINYDMQSKIVEIVNNGGNILDPSSILTSGSVIGSYYTLSSDAAELMLYQHAINSYHNSFYDFIKNNLGDYPPKRIKKYAIADAAWALPYPNTSFSGARACVFTGKEIYVKDKDLFPGTFIDIFNGMPGWTFSIGCSFFTLLSIGGINDVASQPNFSNDTYYKPTFIPINSVFDLRNFDITTAKPPKNQSELDAIAKKYSPFDKLYIVDPLIRHEHITFDNALMKTFMMALNDKNNISPIINFLLEDNNENISSLLISNIFGFENSSYWALSSGSSSLNTTIKTHGNASLQISGGGYQTINSADISTSAIMGSTSNLSIDVYLGPTQPNIYWIGQVQLLVSCPSAGLYNVYIGQNELTNLTLGAFHTLSFTLPSNVLTVLKGNYSDFSFEWVLNTNANSGPYCLDNMIFTTRQNH